MLRFVLLLSLCLTLPLQAGPKWSDGEYGPVLSVAMAADGRKLGEKKQLQLKDLGNFVFRARLISLNDDKSSNVCFDTELLRMAAGWSGGFVEWKGAFKNMGPAITGEIQFSTQPRPGWSLDGKFVDPRSPKEGPLPRKLGKYRGTYIHGSRVVLSYRVGQCSILEMPEALQTKGLNAFARTLTLGPSPHPISMLLCESENAKGNATEKGAILRDRKSQWRTAGVDLPQGAKWEVREGQIILHFPAIKQKTTCRVILARCDDSQSSTFQNLMKREIIDPTKFTKGGPTRWKQILTTQGKVGKDDQAYVVDDIPGPIDNPWKSWLRFGALDFFDDGRAAISTWDGDVWIVSGLDRELKSVKWKRFATGLMHPLGLKIIKGIIYVAGRDQITKLHDLNGDDEADFHECFNNDAGLTPQRHEYVMDLQVDRAGNLYYCRSGHYTSSQRGENCCVMRVSPDGKKLSVLARGFREPNGMSISPEGLMTVADNEGNGVPQTPLYILKENAFYGFTPPGTKKRSGWRSHEPALVWIPKTVDRSAGGQVWVTSKKWGPLYGHLLHTSYGHCRLYHVMIDQVEKTRQGFVTVFPLTFYSGIMRARFHPKDGQLYLCGLRGWGTKAAKDGQFCRVRYTGKPFSQPIEMQVTHQGFRLRFDQPLDRKSVEDVENWGGEFQDVFAKKGRRKRKGDLEVVAVKLSKDGKTVDIELEEITPVTSVTLLYSIKNLKGAELSGQIYGTIHRVPKRN